jgi:hypothetical protein
METGMVWCCSFWQIEQWYANIIKRDCFVNGNWFKDNQSPFNVGRSRFKDNVVAIAKKASGIIINAFGCIKKSLFTTYKDVFLIECVFIFLHLHEKQKRLSWFLFFLLSFCKCI